MGAGVAWMNGGRSGMQPLSPEGRVPELSGGVTCGVMWAEGGSICADRFNKEAVFRLRTMIQ